MTAAYQAGNGQSSDLKHVSQEKSSSSVSLSGLLAPFLSPFLDGKGSVADVINYVAGLIFSTIKPMTRQFGLYNKRRNRC